MNDKRIGTSWAVGKDSRKREEGFSLKGKVELLLKVGDRPRTRCLLEHFWFKWDRKLFAKWLKQKRPREGGEIYCFVRKNNPGAD